MVTTLEGIEQPKICSECWLILENFNRFYNTVEELHQPQPDSSVASSDGENEQMSVTFSETEVFCNDEQTTELPVVYTEPTDQTKELSTDEEEADVADSINLGHEANACETSEQLSNIDQELIEFYGPLVCDHCGTEFENVGQLKRHLLHEHQVRRGSVKCPHCSKRLYTRFELRQHVEFHRKLENKAKRFRCVKCGNRYCLKSELTAHMKVSHSAKDVMCGVCHKM
uniref:C2H2-type domain-containing protein n=1 Tax=Anopheles farauti TaxID=69004 RepID=A0A182QXB8_9DIPT